MNDEELLRRVYVAMRDQPKSSRLAEIITDHILPMIATQQNQIGALTEVISSLKERLVTLETTINFFLHGRSGDDGADASVIVIDRALRSAPTNGRRR